MWSSFPGWEMCEGVWRTAMGLVRQWLHTVTIAVAICLLSEYANGDMNVVHIFPMYLHKSFFFLNFQRSLKRWQAFTSDDFCQFLVDLLPLKCFFRKPLRRKWMKMYFYFMHSIKDVIHRDWKCYCDVTVKLYKAFALLVELPTSKRADTGDTIM